MVSVLIVDDQELVRTGVRRLLEDRSVVNVIGEAASGEEAIKLGMALSPDVILMDLQMPGLGGLEATRKLLLQNPGQKIIILTSHSEGTLPKALLALGVAGYLTKDCAVEEIVTAIEQVSSGEKYLAPAIAHRLALQSVDRTAGSPFDCLSHRELQIVMMLVQGQRNRDIAEVLCLSPKTVSTYRTRIMEKLKISNAAELVRLAIQHRLIEQQPRC